MQTYCNFTQGIITTAFQNTATAPVSTFASASTVYNVQWQVYSYGGAREFNKNSPTFSPTSEDVLGCWSCVQQNKTAITSTDWPNYTSLSSYLQQQNLLYQQASNISGVFRKNVYFDFLAWNADQTDDSPTPWNVKASMSNNLTGSTATVTNLECSLVQLDQNWTPPIMPSQDSLHEWGPRTLGFLMTDPSSFFPLGIEWMLNAMVMVSGSGNTDQLTPSDLPEGENTTFGCTVQGTKIQLGIWVNLGLVFLVFLSLILGSIWYLISQCFQSASDADLPEAAPSSVQEWQLVLLREAVKEEGIKLSQLGEFSYGWDETKHKYVLDRTMVFQARGEGRKVEPGPEP